MYIGTVLLYVQELLRDSFLNELDPQSIQITADEKPWPTSGENVITIHPSRWDTGNVKTGQSYVGERVAFSVTCIVRTRKVPFDRLGNELFIQTTDSLSLFSSIVSNILNKLSSSNNTLTSRYLSRVNSLSPTLKNLLLPTGLTANTIEQFEWLDTDGEPVKRYPDFFRERPNNPGSDEQQIAGYSMTGNYLSPTLVRGIKCATT
jgi:hypothetical protein